MNAKERSKIRQTGGWKELRRQVASLFENRDPITNDPLKRGWNLHHMDLSPENYSNFAIMDSANRRRFLPLNKTTHKLLHSIYRAVHRKKRPMDLQLFLVNLQKYVDEMGDINRKE